MAHFVVAVKEKKPEKTASGIFLPESAQEKSEAAKVIAVGSAVEDVAVEARGGYKNYAATTIKLDKEEYLIIKDEDILATVE
jgi:chaperonin 10 Kd subunit